MKKRDYYEEYYDEHSAHWDALYKADESTLSVYSLHHRERMKVIGQMIAQLQKHESSKALDVGCGPGAYLPLLSTSGYEVFGFDISEKMLAHAKANLLKHHGMPIHFDHGDIHALPYRDKTFDLVLCIGVIMYVDDDRRVLSELARVLKPGGHLIIATDNKTNFADLVDFPMRLRSFVTKLARQKRYATKTHSATQASNSRCYSPREIHSLLLRAGFSVNNDAGVGLAPLLFNGKRFLSPNLDLIVEKRSRALMRLPFLRKAGYIYICAAKRTDST